MGGRGEETEVKLGSSEKELKSAAHLGDVSNDQKRKEKS